MVTTNRKNPPRQAPSHGTNTSQPAQTHRSDAFTDFQARRLQRRLDDLERTNPTDIPASSFVPASQTQGQGKKKQTPNVRRILYNKKSLKDWLDELVRPIPPTMTHSSSHLQLRIPSPAILMVESIHSFQTDRSQSHSLHDHPTCRPLRQHP
ncbi:MAG: hypothetical protein TREMPRED_004054 [Tremellales sp. Tagirdzhanova-0007]|nr:MAG: hypothetical protein TREMPRED_004054 [Tremellales sp. Tagirdzhanova-0007]